MDLHQVLCRVHPVCGCMSDYNNLVWIVCSPSSDLGKSSRAGIIPRTYKRIAILKTNRFRLCWSTPSYLPLSGPPSRHPIPPTRATTEWDNNYLYKYMYVLCSHHFPSGELLISFEHNITMIYTRQFTVSPSHRRTDLRVFHLRMYELSTRYRVLAGKTFCRRHHHWRW